MKALSFTVGLMLGVSVVLGLRTRVTLVRTAPGEQLSTEEFDELWDSGVALLEGNKEVLGGLWDAFEASIYSGEDE